MKKILVLGSKGMAGHVVMKYLDSVGKYNVYGVARGEVIDKNAISLDVSDISVLKSIILDNQFNVVINCIGILNKTAEDNPDQAVWFNSYLPHLLERWGKEIGFKLIHISTDCVFSGKEGGYHEDSFKNGIGFYAQSKALGEVANTKDLTFRTSIIGPELKTNGIGLFHWFMMQNDVVYGYSNAFWTGITTVELAKAIDEAIQQDLTGLYHLVFPKKISKFDLLLLFNEIFRNGEIQIEKKADYKVDKSLLNGRTDFDYLVPDYRRMMEEMEVWMRSNPDSYSHYTNER